MSIETQDLLKALRNKLATERGDVNAIELDEANKIKCCICGWTHEKFLDFNTGHGHIYQNAKCLKCGSQPRHRSFYLYLANYLPRNEPFSVLHLRPKTV